MPEGEIRVRGNPYIRTAVVRSTGNLGCQVGVEIEGADENWIGASINVLVVGDQPRIGQRGLVIFPSDNHQGEGGFWLGTIANRYQDEEEEDGDSVFVELPQGARGLFNAAGTCGFTAADSSATMVGGGTSVVVLGQFFRVTKGANSMQFEDDAFTVNLMDRDRIKSKIDIRKSGIEALSGGSFVMRGAGNVEFRHPGNFVVTGPTNGDEERPIDLFKVKCNRAALDAGAGSINVGAGAINVKIGSSQLSMAGGVPGTGPRSSFAMEVVQGKIDVSAGLGDVTLRALGPTNKILIRHGMAMAGPMSYGEFGIMKAKLGAETTPATGAWLELTRIGDAKLDAFKSVSIRATTTSVTLSAMTELKLRSAAKAILDSMLAEFKAQTKMTIATMMLELKDAAMINFGPKTVIPSATGPLCSIPVCPLTGAVHVGEKCAG